MRTLFTSALASCALVLAALLPLPIPALAQNVNNAAQCHTLRNGDVVCPPVDSFCVQSRYGDWMCSPPGGGALVNINGEPVCGAGACVTNINNEVMCSTQPRGAAALDRYSQAVCTGGCAKASAQSCKPLRP